MEAATCKKIYQKLVTVEGRVFVECPRLAQSTVLEAIKTCHPVPVIAMVHPTNNDYVIISD